MTKTPAEFYAELKKFRSQLIEIRISNDKTKLEGILDKYGNDNEFTEKQFEVFAENYHIAGFGPEHVRLTLPHFKIEFFRIFFI